MTILGIESSCDETAAAVVRGQPGGVPAILSNVVLSQLDAHAPYGGVVPEIAARAHVEAIDAIIGKAMAAAEIGFDDLDAVAATAGPGLIGGVLVGLTTAKGIALARDLPLVAVNHLEGHALSPRLVEPVPFPYLLLLISGGHCQLLSVLGPGRYRRLGTTIDDAVGEAFDKVAKLLGLGYPGGPAVERAARQGKPGAVDLPRPMRGRPGADMSFSGLKTAVRHAVLRLGTPTEQDIADLCASFQAVVAETLSERTANAIALFEAQTPDIGERTLVVAGGVAANQAIRTELDARAACHGYRLVAPPPRLCTDNGAMIAWAGIERFCQGHTDDLTVAARPRWPLDDAAPAREPRSGAKGARA